MMLSSVVGSPLTRKVLSAQPPYTRMEDELEDGTASRRGNDDKTAVADEDDLRGDEEPWTASVEKLLDSICIQSEDLAQRHTVAGRHHRKMHRTWAIPPLLLSAILAPLTSAFAGEEWITPVEVSGYVLIGCFGALSNVLDNGSKSERHFAFSSRYADLSADIRAMMAKPRRYREQVDVFSLRIKMMFAALGRAAPDV